MLDALGFFLLVEVVGLAAVPLAGLAFGRLPGAGLGFAKPLGLLLVTWVVWMLASVTPVSYGTTTILVVVALLAFAGALTAARQRTLAARLTEPAEGWWARRRAEWIGTRALPVEDPVRVRLWLGSEIVFAVAFAATALLVAYSPDVWGTEKPMDMAFMHGLERLELVPAARPLDGRRGAQLLLLRPPRDGDRDQGRRHRAGRRLQPGAGAGGGALGDRRVHARRHRLGRRPAAARRRPRRARGGRRHGGRRVHRARQPGRRARVARRGRSARATTTGSRPRA